MAKNRQITKALCASSVLACLVAIQPAARADVKCFSDGSFARTLDVSKGDAVAYCEAYWNQQKEDEQQTPSQSGVQTPQSEEPQIPADNPPEGARSVPAPTPIALILAGLAMIGSLRRRGINA